MNADGNKEIEHDYSQFHNTDKARVTIWTQKGKGTMNISRHFRGRFNKLILNEDVDPGSEALFPDDIVQLILEEN
ncbi:E3 ubiquitin-protein ligase [Acrasis kona]|uniref:E3 ubiquitin-protein ligase n=1 Tax=Acrasis kona TaxID=1008807 RepID=A0AAW2ZPK7_9EUKA